MTDEDAGLAADAVGAMCRELGLPRNLRELDVPEEGLEFIAGATLRDRSLSTNPNPITDAGTIMEALRAAF
jgi:alcohol dehydrogenase class IV